MVIALAGRRVDPEKASPSRFPVENVELVARKLRELFQSEGATALVSSAACGADLIALREAGALGLRRRVVLPFDRKRFRDSSVTDRPGDWGGLFDSILDEVASAGDLVTLQGQSGGDADYGAANLAILDEAQAIGRATGQNVSAVIVWEGKSRGEGDLTEAFADAARDRMLSVLEVTTV